MQFSVINHFYQRRPHILASVGIQEIEGESGVANKAGTGIFLFYRNTCYFVQNHVLGFFFTFLKYRLFTSLKASPSYGSHPSVDNAVSLTHNPINGHTRIFFLQQILFILKHKP